MIELHPEKKMPLYEQLYNALAQDIRSGALQPGKALPGRRTMAAQLGISTNTVDTAYQMLAAEGLAVTRPRSGFFVQETGGMLHTRPQHSVVPAPKATPKNTVSNQDDILYDLSTGSIDTSLFPARSWGRIQKELMYQRPELLQRGDMQGDENLRAQIAAYLGEYRGVDCTADQVVVGAGVEYLLGCLAHLFAGSTAAVENPGYSRTRAVLENNGIPCVPVEIDESGLPIRALEQSGANLCYVTPSHHFPTGVTMPAPRRAQLLAWAAAKPGRFILEDDYDSEFRFATRPLPSLQGMSGANGPGWSTCWAAWHTCLRAAPPRWKTPATAAPAPYWKTTASPAYRWKLTKAVCRSARWSKAEPTCAMLPPATTFPPALPCRPPGARSC